VRASPDRWLAIGLIAALVLVTLAVAFQQTPVIPYVSTSAAPSGTLALKLWLQALGYTTSDEGAATDYQPPEDADLILILQPIVEISDSEWALLEAQIHRGTTLILAGDSFPSQNALEHFGFSTIVLDQETTELTVQNPLLASPLLKSPIPIKAAFALAPTRSDFVAHLAVGDEPVLVSFNEGAGRVILASTADPFSNLALKDPGSATLVLNLIALASGHHKAWFDEWHHGIQNAPPVLGPEQALRQTPLGNALLFAVAVIFVGLLLQGRGFGRSVPLPRELRRRGPLEHVTAIANLSRKAGHRRAVLEEYRHRLKRHLGRRYSLDPSLPDAEYVHALALYSPGLDQAGLLSLLKGLSGKNVGEGEMVQLAARAADWMKADG